MNKLKVGILGTGDIFNSHYEAIKANTNVELVCLCDLVETTIPNLKFYTDYKKMLDSEKIDVIHILTPHHLHFEHITEIAKRNIHCLVEKPLVKKVEDIAPLLKLEKEKSAKIGCIFQNRYNPTIVELKNQLKSKKCGKILGIKGILTWSRTQEYYDSKDWRKNNGVLISQAIHTLDLIQHLAGPIDTIKGSLFNITDLDITVEDSAMINMNFKNGTKGLLIATNAYIANSSIEIEVVTEKAVFNIKNNQLTLVDENFDSKVLVKDPLATNEKSYYGTSHKIIIDNFYDAIIHNTNNYIDVNDATISLRIIDFALKSSKLKTSVKFN